MESLGKALHFGYPPDPVSLDMRVAKRSAGVPGHRSGLKLTPAHHRGTDVKGKELIEI